MSTTGHETETINVQGLKGALKKGGNKGIFNEATCSTAAGTAAKEITTAPKSFSLVSGAKILVTFTNAITVANATLQVGSATAKPIYYHGAALAANLVKAGSVLLLVYDGTRFNIVGDLDTDTTYTDMAASGTNHKGGLVPDPGDTEGTSKYLCEDGTWKTPPDTTYESKAATEGGTQTSLVTTGEKYTWNQKVDPALIGAANGIAPLNENSQVPNDNLHLPNNIKTANVSNNVLMAETHQVSITQGGDPDRRLSAPGWYRIGSEAGGTIDVIIHQFFNNAIPTSIRVVAMQEDGSGQSQTWRITQLVGVNNSHIDQVRITYENSKAWIEFHYTLSSKNGISWKFLHGTPLSMWEAGGGTVLESITILKMPSGCVLTQDVDRLLGRVIALKMVNDTSGISGAVSVDASVSNIHKVTASGHISGITIDNMKPGQQVFVHVFASSSGSRNITIAHNTTYRCPKAANIAVTIPASGNACFLFTCITSTMILVSPFNIV